MYYNPTLIEKVRENGVTFTNIEAVMEALGHGTKEATISVPPEQRKTQASGKTYHVNRERFLASLVVNAFAVRGLSEDFTSAVDKALSYEKKGNVVMPKYAHGAVQIIGLSVSADKQVFLSDGNHRFNHYLKDFLNGSCALVQGTDFGDDCLNSKMDEIFKRVIRVDGKDEPKAPKKITAEILGDYLQDIMNLPVIALSMRAPSEQERAYLFYAMNNGVPITQADKDKSMYGTYSAYQCIQRLYDHLSAIKIRKGETLTYAGRQFDAVESMILRILLFNKMSALVPMIAHAFLLTYLPRKMVKNYPWSTDSQQSQEEQVRNFFKATEHMTCEEFNKYLFAMMDDMIYIGRILYNADQNSLNAVKGAKSLLVGQLHSIKVRKEYKIPKAKFEEIAWRITDDMVYGETGYTPVGMTNSVSCSNFKDGHRRRSKNEQFAQWVVAEYMKEVQNNA